MATKQNLSNLSKAQRSALAKRIVKLRDKGVAWDGPKGICEQLGIAGAPVGRQLMREVGAGAKIAATYDHKAAAAKRKGAAKPKATAKKSAAKKRAPRKNAVKVTQVAPNPTTEQVAAALDQS